MRVYRSIAMAALVAFGLAGASAQEPAWKRVARKLKPNSMEVHPEAAQTGETAQVPFETVPAVANLPRKTGGQVQGALLPAEGTIGVPSASGEARRSKIQINLGRESEEAGSINDLFSEPRFKRMLGEAPRFIYNANNRPDPMVFPPVRNAAIFAELKLEAERLIEEGELAGALEAYKKILALNDRRYLVEARNQIADLSAQLGAIASTTDGDGDILAELPLWIRDNTRGILLIQSSPMCLVGDFLLKAGEAVPSYPRVQVASIDKEKVTFEVAGQKFEVEVKGYE